MAARREVDVGEAMEVGEGIVIDMVEASDLVSLKWLVSVRNSPLYRTALKLMSLCFYIRLRSLN